MNPFVRRRHERRARLAQATAPIRVWNPAAGLRYCSKLPIQYLEPICERISRVQGEKFHRLCMSIDKHGLANPLITVTYLPEQNLADWREWRYRFLYTIDAPVKVVVGHNRYAAILALGWTHVPVIHCGPVSEAVTGVRWRKLKDVAAAQALCKDGRLGLGPYSLVMDQFTPPLKGVPAGFEA